MSDSMREDKIRTQYVFKYHKQHESDSIREGEMGTIQEETALLQKHRASVHNRMDNVKNEDIIREVNNCHMNNDTHD